MASSAALAEEHVERLFTPPATTQSSSVTVIAVGATSDQVSGLAADVEELRNIVVGLSSHSPLQLSPRLEAVIDHASQLHGGPRSIEEWARTLAGDVQDLAD